MTEDEGATKDLTFARRHHQPMLPSTPSPQPSQDLHKQLERKISTFHGTEDTILYPSCFDANVRGAWCGPSELSASGYTSKASLSRGRTVFFRLRLACALLQVVKGVACFAWRICRPRSIITRSKRPHVRSPRCCISGGAVRGDTRAPRCRHQRRAQPRLHHRRHPPVQSAALQVRQHRLAKDRMRGVALSIFPFKLLASRFSLSGI